MEEKKYRLISILSLLSLLNLFLNTPLSHAYVFVRSSQSGAPVKWGTNTNLEFRANPTNSSGISANDFYSIFTTSLNRWKQIAYDRFSFVYYQGNDSSRYPNYTASTAQNAVFFTSNAAASEQLGCSVIALTQVWYEPGNGQAQRSDLRYNDKCYQFTLNPEDTKTQTKIYLADVTTHELGHVFGLDHSQNLQSSMIFTAAINMDRPSCDDQSAIRSNFNIELGSISGTILSPSGAPVFGAHVNAIHLEKAISYASAITDRNGSFKISGLDSATYALEVEPYYPGPSALSPYYADIKSTVCSGGKNFERTFIKNSKTLSRFEITAAQALQAGSITVDCNPPTSLNQFSETNFFAAPTLNIGETTQSTFATNNSFTSTVNEHYYKIPNAFGKIKAAVIAYTLFSPADFKVDFMSSNGYLLSQNSIDNIYSNSLNGYVNFDSSSEIELSSAQTIYLRVQKKSNLNSSRYPSRGIGMGDLPYYAVTVENTAEYYSATSLRCESYDQFGPYPNQGEAPNLPAKKQKEEETSGCGTIKNISDNDSGPFNQSRILNFTLVLIMVMIASQIAKKDQKILPHIS